MAKLNEKYETMVVFSLKSGEEQIESLKTKFSDLISANAELVNVSEWGKRRLAYPINYENDGYYVLYGFDSKPDFPKELERVLNITDGILRFLTVLRHEAPAAEPSVEPKEPKQEAVKDPEKAPEADGAAEENSKTEKSEEAGKANSDNNGDNNEE
jgi:small subunit ribosomal protein S6